MEISNKGIDLIKKYEGCRLKAYYCPSGVLTIGWGRTHGVYDGQVISQEQADQFFIEDVKKYYPNGNFNQNQFDALTSFAYNCGLGALNDVLYSGDIAGNMILYVNGSFGVLPGLQKRRKEEVELYNTRIVDNIVDNFSYSEDGIAIVLVDVLNVRDNPSLSSNVVATYNYGESFSYNRVILNDGYYWVEYTSFSGYIRYVASRTSDSSKIYLKCE